MYVQKKVNFWLQFGNLGFFSKPNMGPAELGVSSGTSAADPRHLSTKSLGFGAFRQGKKVELQAGFPGFPWAFWWWKPWFFLHLKKRDIHAHALKHMKLCEILVTDMIQLDILKYTIDVYWCWCFFLSFCWSIFCPFFRHLFSARNHRQGSMQRRQSEPIDPGTPPPSSPSGFDKQRRNYFSCFDCNGCGCSF